MLHFSHLRYLGQERTESDDVTFKELADDFTTVSVAVLLISYHPLKAVKFTLKLLIMIFFLKYNTKQHY